MATFTPATKSASSTPSSSSARRASSSSSSSTPSTMGLFLVCLILPIAFTHAVPVTTAKRTKAKAVSVFNQHPVGLIDPLAAAMNTKLHNNMFLASAYQMPHSYAAMGGVGGFGGGMASYNNYMTHAGTNPYAAYGGGYGFNIPYNAASYIPAVTGYSTNSHDSYYSNHWGLPNGYNVNQQATYVPTGLGYPTLGGKKTTYSGVRSHVGGMKKVQGTSINGHNGVTPYNYGTHEEHINLPGLTKVTYTHRYPVLPAFGMYSTYGAYNGY